ncbi:hypothetical protein B0H13DRAFT_1942873 [Mycena leptocephala]|nr:hypothetical protein B0H13DRAFT_1942873 [Mycena leptocephala]
MSEKPLPEHTPQVHGHLSHLRGNPNISIPGVATFVLGCLSEAPLQYLMFTQGWAVKGLVAVDLPASNFLVTAGPGVAGLGPIPTLLTGMYAVAGLRQGYWVLFTSSFQLPTSISLQLVAYNTTLNTINTLVAQWAGLALFAIGISMETIAGESRKQFEKDPKNKGKIDDTGLWSLVRHPNYLGYFLWRTGITLATGSIVATVALTAMQVLVFFTSGIPGITSYMSVKYGKQWEDYKRRVPYAIIPGIV